MLGVVILAAGHGTRLNKNEPKPVTPVGGKPCLAHLLETINALSAQHIVIVHAPNQQATLAAACPNQDKITWVCQETQLGTGHALACALPALTSCSRVLVLLGDTPLIQAPSLQNLLDHTQENEIGILTAHLDHPTGYGRILRNSTRAVTAIIEERHATPAEKAIKEINSGILCLPQSWTSTHIDQIKQNSTSHEYYLTDLIAHATAQGLGVRTAQAAAEEVCGINTLSDLVLVERHYQRRLAQHYLQQGIHIADVNRFDCRGTLSGGKNCFIDINVILQGKVVLGTACHIAAHSQLTNVTLGNGVTIHSHCVIEDCTIEDGATIGPFAHCRPGSQIGANSKIGSFVEIKSSTIGVASKIPHLSYIGNATIGAHCNIGAGTITCNYNGAQKFNTFIHDHAFIGAGTQLVAPVTVHAGATIGAGSCITQDAPANKLTYSRIAQRTVDHWSRPHKTKNDPSKSSHDEVPCHEET